MTPSGTTNHGKIWCWKTEILSDEIIMRFSPGLLDEIRARLPVSQVVARKVKLKRQGREFAGLSPFKAEKTPSFFVNDQKGFYHCFASAEHGDIFTFVMKTEGLSFPEAVERLAGEAGVSLPKPTARDAERADERARLLQLMEKACVFFQDALTGPAGKAARDYLAGRGLDRRTISRFGIGFAPERRTALCTHLAAAGFTQEEMAKTGMLISGKDIAVPYDRFRNRIMFPIADLRGKTIAFGGRALDPAARAKYLNSPETPLFHKGYILFNGKRAREAAHASGQVIVVEGYMDVVALSQAGIDNAVAPLGTALTQDQLRLLWRMAPEPTLCFDGDSAGRRAAYRALDTALPHLAPGQSLRFAFLPDGMDPDDLVRQAGPSALQDCLKQAKPMADMLWDGVWETGDWSTPERRARFEADVMSKVDQIADRNVRAHYVTDIRSRLSRTWGPSHDQSDRARRGSVSDRPLGNVRARDARPHSRGRPSGSYRPEPAVAGASVRGSGVVAGPSAALPRREALLVRQLINQPRLLADYAEEIAALTLTSLPLTRLRDALLALQVEDFPLDKGSIRHHLTGLGFGSLLELIDKANSHKADRFAEADAEPIEAERGWRHALALHNRQLELKQALQAAQEAWDRDLSEEAFARLKDINRQLNEAATSDDVDHQVGGTSPI